MCEQIVDLFINYESLLEHVPRLDALSNHQTLVIIFCQRQGRQLELLMCMYVCQVIPMYVRTSVLLSKYVCMNV